MKLIKSLVLVLTVVILITAVGLAILNYVKLREFYSTAKKEFIQPGIDDTEYDQQGFAYDKQTNLFFFSGYMKDSKANPIYVVDADSGVLVKTVRLSNTDGSPFQGHSGGIVMHGDYFYVAGSNDDCLYVFLREDILYATDGQTVSCIGKFMTKTSDTDGVRASHISIDTNRLYVGEFSLYFMPWYRMRSNHIIIGDSGPTYAILVGFDFDEEAEFGLNPYPSVAYALPDLVQHAVFDGENLILSESFSFIPTVIETSETELSGSFTIMNTEVPLYTLKSLNRRYALPMVEGIAVKDNRIFLSNELYNFIIPKIGNIWGSQFCYSIATYR